MASAGPPPLSTDGLWFWDGSRWKSLVSADGQTSWNGKAWVPLPPFLIGKPLQPPSTPPAGAAAPTLPASPAPTASPPAYAPPPPPPAGPLPSPPDYGPPPPPPAYTGGGGLSPLPPPPGPPPTEVEPRPSWLPADAPWPPAIFNASPDVPLTTDAPMAAPAAGAVPWADVYSNVIASSTGYHSYAGFWIRFIAYVIDSLIIGIPFVVLYFVVFTGSGETLQLFARDTTYSNALNLVGWALSFGYFVSFWTLGSTPGMRLFGIRVADQTTFQSIGVGKAVLRFVGWVVASFCCAIGLIWAAFDSRKQGWHDKIGGTVVIYR